MRTRASSVETLSYLGQTQAASLCRPLAPPLISPPYRRCHGYPEAAPGLVEAARPAWSPLCTPCRGQWEPMELTVAPVNRARKQSGLGRCRHFFWLGVTFDAVGVAILFTGVFVNLLFYDLLVYLGSITIFFSLLWWISWYTGNIELLPEETMKRAAHLSYTALVQALRQSISHRYSMGGETTTSFLRIPRRRPRRQRTLRRKLSLKMTTSELVEKQLEKENKDTEGGESVKESGALQDSCKEDLGPKPEDDKRSEAVGSPGPSAGLPRFGRLPWFSRLPWFGQRPSTLLGRSVFPPVQPLFPTTLASRNQRMVLQSQLESLLLAPQTGQASGTQGQGPHVSLMQFAATQSFQTVDSRPVHNLEALLQMHQGTPSTSLVWEIFIKQSSNVPKVPKNQVAQGFETSPQASQKSSQELPDIPSPVTEDTAPARQAQQSRFTESAPDSVEVKKSRPL
ncbi:uncharacterized protein LOC128562551 [Nycticebus coucang]|uniref:uncharacterized protein LOC128562551 n=1 Tax=Nycticebus coucang TaxID=9470 RepID=UPI00234C3AC2|nr:uncharacterized protein LOC128562551 [Nycticebus coucang]XP_053413579.1 uncharacterized protein LOC128562551 [Nycticebus coucang]XP_053413580.1 uncharacterized protein LOC128562551 [Nycticebus coucang]XP_053413581.1 uncharacterized protein LOC128562551 [Nycticebus coucang]XP_053413583.1 uncharacterized protein LOC128562551 [Nycticebus coucang]XP_053413584.1 uncharacterized protein LOC128562551 [Nycticebus coucang]XP_053413585.1 uncharacterized protein LOC128562551 [Nycticebus coucang]